MPYRVFHQVLLMARNNNENEATLSAPSVMSDLPDDYRTLNTVVIACAESQPMSLNGRPISRLVNIFSSSVVACLLLLTIAYYVKGYWRDNSNEDLFGVLQDRFYP